MDMTMKDLILDAMVYQTVITFYLSHMILAPRLEAIFHEYVIGCIAKLLI